MSYPRYKIVFPRKKKGTPVSELEYTESNHPVLQGYRDKIAELEASIAKAKQLDDDRVSTIMRLRNDMNAYEENVKNVLVTAHSDDQDKATIEYIAEQLGISLTVTKQFEVNVTFTIDVECELGEIIDPDWDFEYSVSHSDIIDYQSDVIWSKEIS
jgi:hypothetical protein